jgi:hypothetical protein
MKAEDFDKKFDKGEDVTRYLDLRRSEDPSRNRSGSTWTFPSG